MNFRLARWIMQRCGAGNRRAIGAINIVHCEIEVEIATLCADAKDRLA